MSDNRIEIDGDYLIIAPNPQGFGYVHSLTERAFLVDNILNFFRNYPEIKPHQVTVYELKQVNEALPAPAPESEGGAL